MVCWGVADDEVEACTGHVDRSERGKYDWQRQCTAGFFCTIRCQRRDREHDTGDRRIERGGNTGRVTGEDQAAPDTRRIVTPDEVRDRRADLYGRAFAADRSEEHTSELQSLMRISYAVFCLKKKKRKNQE